MQLAYSRIWTRVSVSIFYDDNHCTTGTSSSPRPPPIYNKELTPGEVRTHIREAKRGIPHGVKANVLESNIEVTGFEIQ